MLKPENQVVGAVFNDVNGDWVEVHSQPVKESCDGCKYHEEVTCINLLDSGLPCGVRSWVYLDIIFKDHKPHMKFIANWQRKDLECVDCHTKASVKYSFKGENYCNLCILGAVSVGR